MCFLFCSGLVVAAICLKSFVFGGFISIETNRLCGGFSPFEVLSQWNMLCEWILHSIGFRLLEYKQFILLEIKRIVPLSLSPPHLNASFSDVELFLLVAEIHPTVISFLQWLCLFILNISSTIEQYQHLSIGQEQIRFGFKVDFFFFRFPRLLRFSIQIPYHVNRTRNDVK